MHSNKKFKSFKDIITYSFDNTCSLFANYDGYVYSLRFDFDLDPNTKFIKIYNICWQEEYLNGSLHNVCMSHCKYDCKKDIFIENIRNNITDNYVLYDIDNDIIIKDAYLFDKYGDCSDGWFSDRIFTVFRNYPKIISDKFKV